MAPLVDGTPGREEHRADTEQTSEFAWALEGDTTAFKKALNPTFDLYRCATLHHAALDCHQVVRGLSHVLDVSLNHVSRGDMSTRGGMLHLSPSANIPDILPTCDEMLDGASCNHVLTDGFQVWRGGRKPEPQQSILPGEHARD